jgi:hypothetical protein
VSRLSDPATRAVLAPETDKVFLHLLSVGIAGSPTLRLVDNTSDVVSRGETYSAVGFSIILPEQTADGPRPCKLSIDNADLAIFSAIKWAVNKTVTITVCVVMADTPDVYERGPLKYRLRNVRATKEAIEGEVYDFYLTDRKFPKDTYAPEDFEGMYF